MNSLKIIIFCLAIFCLLAYVSFLNITPPHLNQDELGGALNAYSIAKTGFDENGRFLPLYFWHLGNMWTAPVIVYLTVPFLLFLPLSEVSIRLPSLVVGFTNLILLYFISTKIFKDRKFAWLTVFLLALIPVHFIQSRMLIDNLYPVPFMLGWLFCLISFMEKGKIWKLLLGCFLLGVGVHAYHAAKVMMPLYLLLTYFFLYREILKNKWLIFIPLLGFIIPLLPLIPWLDKYPDTLTDQVRYTRLYDTSLSPLEGIKSLVTSDFISSRIGMYLSYFDPGFLFFKGDLSLVHSTHILSGLPVAFALLIPLGIYQLVKTGGRVSFFIIVGFLTAPVAAALVNEPVRMSRQLFILPFATLLAVYGIKFLLDFKHKSLNLLTSILLVLVFLQFTFFLADYFTAYRSRYDFKEEKVYFYGWYRYNVVGSLEALLNEEQKEPSNRIYLDGSSEFIDRYWRFVLIKNNREELLLKTQTFSPDNFSWEQIPDKSLIIFRFDHLPSVLLDSNLPSIQLYELDNSLSFYIFRK